MKKILFLTVFILSLTCLLHAQSADEVTKMIQTNRVSYGQACYFFATSGGLIDEEASYGQALDALKNQKLLPSDTIKFENITLDDISFICVKLWKIKGSLLYKIFPTRRYAFRLMKAHSLIPANADPKKTVNGHEFLNILSDCIAKFPNNN